ncbi:MAG: AraC family transcriptional regulator [Acidobacteriales bacterium]|nr:AraC family transcriptional regulator [Terriglobales bacterium]
MGTSNTISYPPPAMRLSRALLLLENTPGSIQLDEAARAVNLSSSRLRHLVRERLGISPSRYIKHVKLQRAKELLATTELSIKEVMWEAGFTDFSHAVRDYKRLHGETPSQTRERIRSTIDLHPLVSVS